jgi:hypothetical protein
MLIVSVYFITLLLALFFFPLLCFPLLCLSVESSLIDGYSLANKMAMMLVVERTVWTDRRPPPMLLCRA